MIQSIKQIRNKSKCHVFNVEEIHEDLNYLEFIE